MGVSHNWDFFISHASEDKEEVARPLAKDLMAKGFRVWFDELSMTLGDSLSRSIDEGISKSRYGIVILSPSFFAKNWPRRELDSLASLEMVGGEKRILPIWHIIDQKEISEFSPALADKIGVSTAKGLDYLIKEISRSFSSRYSEDIPEIRVLDRVLRPIVEELVIDPSKLSLSYLQGDRTMVIKLEVEDVQELSRIIGKDGRNARALRTILGAVSSKLRTRVILELCEP
jgi:predicted RNA-binding protein YlqC (UPF0109 family)